MTDDSHHNHHHHHNHHVPPLVDTTTPPAVHDHQNHAADHSSHHHPTFFSFDTGVTVLFSGWELNSRTGMFAICLSTIILGILYQGIKHLRVYIHRDIPFIKLSPFAREHTLQTLLYGLQILISNILMLAIMTYNVTVFICTIVGLGLGYFLCEWHRPKNLIGNCEKDCSSKPISRGTTVTRLSMADIRETDTQELTPLSEEDQCQNCKDTKL